MIWLTAQHDTPGHSTPGTAAIAVAGTAHTNKIQPPNPELTI